MGQPRSGGDTSKGSGIEEYLKQATLDDLRDKLQLHEYASVSEYAKAVGEQPQLIHYYIRTGRIEKVSCKCCGRPVIKVEQANEVLTSRKKEQ